LKLKNYDIDWLYPNYNFIQYEGIPTNKFIKQNLTGYCMDYPLSKTWNNTRDIEQCLNSFFEDGKNDYEYQLSEEGFSERCDWAEIYFDEKGNSISNFV